MMKNDESATCSSAFHIAWKTLSALIEYIIMVISNPFLFHV